MSLENNLKRIADSLEKIAGHLDGQTHTAPKTAAAADTPSTAPTPPQASTAGSPPVTGASTVAPQPHEAPVPPAPQPPAAPAPPAQTAMTPEELNNALVVEFRRIGNREPIDQAMSEMGVSSVNDLDSSRYQELLDKVRAVPA